MRTLRYEANKLVAQFNKENWITDHKMKVQSGPEGQTTLLTSRIVIQPCMSSIEGRVVDDKGKPIANLKIIAEQVKPIKGYERFEATTDSDGTFSFGKLFPASEYTFSPWFDDWSLAPQRTLKCAANKVTARFNKEGWTTEDRMKVQSVPEGETIILKIVILPTVSIFDGKLVDGKHKPMANVKIVAKQKHPVVRGYGYFEAETGLDGTFSFKKLFPTSEYTLIPISELWKTNVQKVITTTGEQETLKGELTVRFIIAKGVVSDLHTGLQWAAKDNGRDINWQNARAYCQNYRGGDHTDWRLPTASEFEGLYKAGIRIKSNAIINITKSPWTSETRGSEAACFGFNIWRELFAKPVL